MPAHRTGPGPGASAVEACAHVPLDDAARGLLRPDQTPRAFLDLLLAHERFADAVRLLPHLLPRRVAVWWGCQCVWDVTRRRGDDDARDTLRRVVRWVLAPGEARRWEVRPADEQAALKTPHGCLAMAVLWSDGSLAPPALPLVPPPEHLTARLVGAAVLRAAVAVEPMRYEDRYRHFLDLGLHLAARRNLWTQFLPVETATPVGEAV